MEMAKANKLAIHGGTPVRTEPFPSWPRSTTEMRDSLVHTLEHEKWGVGSEAVKRFEEEFAKFHDARFALSTNSGTAALWIALKAAGVKAGDEVIIPAYTFIATASAVLMANAIPVFVDIDAETLNMDPDLIDGAISEKTRVIMPVHIAGNPCHLTRIGEVAARHRIAMIEDAAQAHGAEWSGRKIGALGSGGIFSFQSTKNMSAGEGGIIVSDDEAFIDTCFSYQNAGRVRSGAWYEHRYLGGNFRLSAFPAALLLAQFEMLESDMNVRDANAAMLDDALEKIPGLSCQRRYSETTRVSHHLYIVLYDKSAYGDTSRDEFMKAVSAEGIPVHTGYKPIYREKLFDLDEEEFPWLKETDFSATTLPVTERVSDEEAIWLKQSCLLGGSEDTLDIVRAFEKVAEVYSSV